MPGWLSASLNSGANYQPGVYLNHQTEQISTIDLKGAHFVAATAPIPTQIKKSGLNLTRVLIIAGIIQLLILGLVGAILLTRSVTHDQIEALGVPVYKNATRLELTKQERDDWLNQVRPTYNNLKNPALEYYKLKQGDEVNALTFYDRALKSQGWEWASYPPVYIINEALIDRVLNYNRGNQTLYLLVSSQHTSERLPSLKERVASDEVLMQIFVAEKPS